jgi:hypothetical protein
MTTYRPPTTRNFYPDRKLRSYPKKDGRQPDEKPRSIDDTKQKPPEPKPSQEKN